jgi:LacI family transcriptional regulator
MATTRKKRSSPRFGRRILFFGDFAYASTKAIVSGVIRFLSGHPEVTLLIYGGHPGNGDDAFGFDLDVDGVITCIGTYKRHVRKLADSRKRRPFAFVCAACDLPSLRRNSVSLVCDDAAISEAAAALLTRHGLTEFGYVGSRLTATWAGWNAARRDAFVKALAARGFSAHVYRPLPRRAGFQAEFDALAAWLRELPKPCGLFASYDQRAMRVLNLCRAEGIAVPEQIHIVGVDNEGWICESTSPTLTSIEPDFEGAGYRAAEALLAMMDGEPGGRTETFGVRRIVERMSTTDLHGSMARAVRARDLLRKAGDETPSVARLAASLGCSVRTLQTSYRAVYGTTVQADIVALRVERAKALLADTRIPVGEIPAKLGFASPMHFARLFRARTGMSMREWRKACADAYILRAENIAR